VIKEISGLPLWLFLLWLVMLLIHSSILHLSPMPWFDETYLASMALNFMETGEFYPPVCPLMDYYYPQAKAYGPGYFMVLAGFFNVIGFDIVQMRFPGLFFGFAFILTGGHMLKQAGVRPFFRNCFVVLLLFDPIFLQNIHSGRMDSQALFLAGLGSLFLLQGVRNGKILPYVWAGLCLGAAALTTPRVAVNMVGAGFTAMLVFISSPGWKQWIRLMLIPLLTAGMYSIWVFWGFGGFVEAWNYFFGQPKEKLYYDNLAQGYISMRKYIPAIQFPALFSFILMLVFWFRKRMLMPWLFWLSLLNLMAFYLLVRDTGIYSVFAMPWLYILMVILADVFIPYPRIQGLMKMALMLLCVLNFSVFAIKNTVILISSGSRNDALVYDQFCRLIPKGSRVIGDEAYYYLTIRSGSDFQYLDRGAAGHQRIQYHTETYNFQYLIVRDPVVNPGELRNYSSKIPLRKIGEITTPELPSLALKLEGLLKFAGIRMPQGYRGIVYQR
jgi:hypothetical protein